MTRTSRLALGLVFILLVPALTTELKAAVEALTTTQNEEKLSLDLLTAREQARLKNYTYQIAQEQETAAYARWWQAWLSLGPSANLQFGYILDNKPMTMVLDLGLMVQEIEMATEYYSGRLSVTQPLFTGGKLLNALNLAGLQYALAQATRQLAWRKLYQEVTEAYFGVKVAEGMVQVMEEYVRQTKEHLAVVKARYGEGSASHYDLLRSEVQLANLQPKLLQTRHGLILARHRLALVLGASSSEGVTLTTSLEMPGQAWPDLAQLKAQALKQRLELVQLDYARRMAEIGHTMALTSNSPNVALSGNWTYYDYQNQGFPPAAENLKHSWQVMLGLNWPLWDNLSAWPKAEEAAARAREIEKQQQALAAGIGLEVESAYLALIAAQETIAAQNKSIEQAEEGYRVASQQYASGLMTNIDVMDAQLALNQAKTQYLQAQYDYIVAQVKLQIAEGGELP